MSSAIYCTLLWSPGAAAFFLTAIVGRVGIAMTSLGIVWLARARTGSYVTAGLVTGGVADAEATIQPQLAPLADRFGQSRVLPSALLAHATAVALVSILGASMHPAVGTVLGAGLAVAGGLCFAAQRRTVPSASGAAGRYQMGLQTRPGLAVLVGVNLANCGFLWRHTDLSDRVRGRARRGGHSRCTDHGIRLRQPAGGLAERAPTMAHSSEARNWRRRDRTGDRLHVRSDGSGL
jgi:hypothetical protein